MGMPTWPRLMMGGGAQSALSSVLLPRWWGDACPDDDAQHCPAQSTCPIRLLHHWWSGAPTSWGNPFRTGQQTTNSNDCGNHNCKREGVFLLIVFEKLTKDKVWYVQVGKFFRFVKGSWMKAFVWHVDHKYPLLLGLVVQLLSVGIGTSHFLLIKGQSQTFWLI